MNKKLLQTLFVLVGILVITSVGEYAYLRFDVTADKRYTLSETTLSIINDVNEPLEIVVYLEGDFPAEFQRLQLETKQYLEELVAENNKVLVHFENPDNQRENLIKRGMMPSQLTIEEDGKLSEAIIFPWAALQYQNKTKIISLLPDGILTSQNEQFQKAIENLEYVFSNAIHQLTKKRQQKIGVITGNGQLQDIFLYSFLTEVSKKYKLAKFTLDSVATKPSQTLQELTNVDLAIIAKPTEKFTEAEKFTLDQFITNGGKTLWMIDNVQADQDSLMATGKMLAYPRDLNLTDLLFSYGIRINTTIIKDLYAAQISLVTGQVGNQPQYQNLDWFYHPLVGGNPNHPITKNIPPIRLQFTNQIDLLENNIRKTPLLASSPLTKRVGTPSFIELQSIAQEPQEQEYAGGNELFAVLLEGDFKSAYKNRVKPFNTPLFKENASNNKMIVIADGDVAKNQVLNGKPTDLNRDKWTNQTFGNKTFLLNAVDYLLDDSGLIQLRNKSLQIKLLDQQKAYKERSFWQLLNVGIPLFILGIFGVLFSIFRNRKYQKL